MYYTQSFPPKYKKRTKKQNKKTYHSWPHHCYLHSHLGSYTSVIGCNSFYFYSLVGWLHKPRGQWEQGWGLLESDL